jgi:DNA-binding CsgD family transcriptional regulator
LSTLTRRERQVFEQVVAGRLNKQIAAELGIVEKTIKVHRARVMRKMRAGSIVELVHLASVVGVDTWLPTGNELLPEGELNIQSEPEPEHSRQ